MTITLTRTPPQGKAVRGTMTFEVDLWHQAFKSSTLENADYLIPAGTYDLESTWSPRFKKFMPEVMNVPDRTGIRIHCGTKPEHSTGCILVEPYILANIKNLLNLFEKFEFDEKITLAVIDPA